MILVKGPKGTVLHTGDFRFKPDMLNYFKDEEIDTLFLDNTFACPDQNFPTQEEAYEKLVTLIEEKRKWEV